MIENISGAAFRDMILCATEALEKNKQQINELNVFPVPDGDTGTNMSMTLRAAAAELQKKNLETIGAAAEAAAAALIRGARGNSGVILSLLFRGPSKSLKGKETANSLEFASAMADGVDAAYKAVMKPAEGTILTVSRVATKAALEFAEAGSDVELMLVCAVEAAKSALSETVNQNPVLKRAGVIDAGGKGYVIILESMLASLQGRATPSVDFSAGPDTAERVDFASYDAGEITFGYCTECIVSRENDKSPKLLRAFLEGLGDSIVVADDEEIIKVHVHTNEPGRILSEALKYGSLAAVKIDNMRVQHTELSHAGAEETPETTEPEAGVAPAEKKYGSVAVCAGRGMAELFRELGADQIVTGGQTMNPSTEDILRELNKTPAETVFVFPNNKNIILAAQQCIPLCEKKVIVVPTKTVPQGISAMLVMDTYAQEEELTGSFNEAISNVHTALVTYAARDSDFDGHRIRAGEYLALEDGVLLGSSSKLGELLEKMMVSFEERRPEFISIYYGEDVDRESAQNTARLFTERFPGAEVNVVNGGQPVYYYMISAE